MPRRARGKNNTPPRRGCLGAVLLLVFGAFLGMGGAAAVAVYVNKLHLPFIAPPTRDSTLTSEESREQSKTEALEFHDALRQNQALPLAEEEEEAPTASRRFVWHLQVGAFVSAAAAEEQRAQLALSGYSAAVRPGKTAAGEIHRVWIGPFPSESAAEELRAQLALQGFGDIPLIQTRQQ